MRLTLAVSSLLLLLLEAVQASSNFPHNNNNNREHLRVSHNNSTSSSITSPITSTPKTLDAAEQVALLLKLSHDVDSLLVPLQTKVLRLEETVKSLETQLSEVQTNWKDERQRRLQVDACMPTLFEEGGERTCALPRDIDRFAIPPETIFRVDGPSEFIGMLDVKGDVSTKSSCGMLLLHVGAAVAFVVVALRSSDWEVVSEDDLYTNTLSDTPVTISLSLFLFCLPRQNTYTYHYRFVSVGMPRVCPPSTVPPDNVRTTVMLQRLCVKQQRNSTVYEEIYITNERASCACVMEPAAGCCFVLMARYRTVITV